MLNIKKSCQKTTKEKEKKAAKEEKRADNLFSYCCVSVLSHLSTRVVSEISTTKCMSQVLSFPSCAID